MDEKELLVKLREAFQEEARERLDALASRLGLLEAQPDASETDDALEVAYREAHSLKGAARAVGLAEIETICQAMEDLLSALKHKKIPLSKPILDVLFQSLDAVERQINGETPEEPVSSLCRKLEELAASGTPEDLPGLKPEIPVTPKPSPPDAGAFAEKAEPTTKRPRAEKTSRTVRVDVERLDLLLRRAEEFISVKLSLTEHFRRLKEIRASMEQMKRTCSFASKELRWLREEAGKTTDLWDFQRSLEMKSLLRFMEANHEQLLATDAKIRQAVMEAENLYRHLESLVNELLDGTREVLLQPFSTILGGLQRMVREVSRQLGKEVQCTVEGKDVEIDRRILEEIKDPLVHLLRNAVDHGLEPPEVRTASGKDPTGRISIRVVREDARKVSVIIEDDGAGIPLDRVKSEAIRRGIISSEEAEGMNDAETTALIFRSELSTRREVTDLSGRGLGMAIVKEKVESLGGRIHVVSKPGRGTCFRLELPISLSTFRGIVVQASRESFVVPTQYVKAVVRVHPNDCRFVDGKETITHSGTVLGLVSLARLLGLPDPEPEAGGNGRPRTALILSAAARNVALEVDRVVEEGEVVIKPLGPLLRKVRNVWGAAVLGDGGLVPVLNPLDLVQAAYEREISGESESSFRRSSDRAKPRLLLAEDSATSRILLQNILEAAGYRVETAVDGADALMKLREKHFDALITDVEMPRMDGFELTRKIRGEEKLKDLPVILVTSLDSREHREQGLEAGADAYIVKNAFDQADLLDAIAQLL